MKAVRFILSLLAALSLAAALIVGWFAFERFVLYPWRYDRFQDQAVAWNATHWAQGTGQRVTVQVTSDAALGNVTSQVTIDCYDKKFARAGGLKGPPALFTKTLSDGPSMLIVPFGPDATHQTPMRDVCYEVKRKSAEWTLPQVTDSHYFWSDIVLNDGTARCFLGNDPRTTRGEITRPTFVSVEQVPLREIVDRATFDARPNQVAKRHPKAASQLYWWRDAAPACWSQSANRACDDAATAICGAPLRNP